LIGDLRIDTIIRINVLEHIDDDLRTLRAMHQLLAGEGRVILFVPAIRWLYGSLGLAFGHVRRYARRELVNKAASAVLEIETTRFVNLPGVLSWFVVGRVLRRRVLDPAAVKFHDRWALPIVSRLERLHPPPIGQNLRAIARGAPTAT
jgi:hypothetical protein